MLPSFGKFCSFALRFFAPKHTLGSPSSLARADPSAVPLPIIFEVWDKSNNKNKKLHTTKVPATIPRREQPHGLAPLRRLALEAPLP